MLRSTHHTFTACLSDVRGCDVIAEFDVEIEPADPGDWTTPPTGESWNLGELRIVEVIEYDEAGDAVDSDSVPTWAYAEALARWEAGCDSGEFEFDLEIC